MHQPANGDNVTVTRTAPDGGTATWTGVVSHALNGGFRLTGTGPTGNPVDTYMGSSDALLNDHGVVQTVALVG